MVWQSSRDQVPGALLRQLGVGLRLLSRASPRRELAEELARIDKRITGVLADDQLTREVDENLFTFAKGLFVAPEAKAQASGARHVSVLGDVGADLT
jgi:hypothetical protein